MKRLVALVVLVPLAVVALAGAVSAAPSVWLGNKPSGAGYPAGEEDRQFAILSFDLAQKARFVKFAPETFRKEALILDSDRDPLDVILRRSQALLADLQSKAATSASASATLAKLGAMLGELKAKAEQAPPAQKEVRRDLFNQACRLRRQIAFANPLLDFNQIVFIKRHLSVYDHMCDQYYGIAQKPGGGIFVLTDPFGANPGIKDLLESSTVGNGRLKGQALGGGPKVQWKLKYDGMGNIKGDKTQGGSFLSPDLSFDGKQLAFAYVECQGEGGHEAHTDPARGHWPAGRAYHLFKVNMDGSGLAMLSDGTFNDFDPCFMPSGRIAFISERRGGYLRCGRVCPTFTLYDMAADGSDVRMLSPHETNEWHPSVTNDGMIIWTRWDYVDRHGCTAHTPWVTTPDGRDPRAIHGNFAIRGKRPDMELDVRAIPGSGKYVATAAPHHGQEKGSLVIVDPRIEDDDAMAPVKRITPDVGFPESQGGSISYGNAWPLSEDYYLCVYEPMEVKALAPARVYGIYLVDSFGNKELIYRDADIASNSPIPVKARPTPPVVPDRSAPIAGAGLPATTGTAQAEATVSIMDVYNSQRAWPAGTKITALRVYQVLPLSIASAAIKHGTGVQIPQGHDSINIARAVLGTVPIEADGSAHFTVPARKELFFQVLDEKGLAVTSMRSATHFQAGEKAQCQGCHEQRHRSPALPKEVPLALRRGPSKLAPDVEGTNPFSYPRLVQPVLNKHCVECHAKTPEKAPRLDAEVMVTLKGSYMNPKTRYFASYISLAPKFGFYDYGGKSFNDERWYRTTPGEFGARASKLYALLEKGHYEVKLSAEEMHRIAVWLDSCSVFYGVYEPELGEAQLRGEDVRPTLE